MLHFEAKNKKAMIKKIFSFYFTNNGSVPDLTKP